MFPPSDRDDAILYEASTHSFIVKIWLEETVEETNRALWRGHITHVPSHRRQYFQALEEITAFIEPYLEQLRRGTN